MLKCIKCTSYSNAVCDHVQDVRLYFGIPTHVVLLKQEEIQKKTGYVVMRAEGVFDVDANTSIDQLSEDLNIKMPEVHIPMGFKDDY